MQSNTGTNQQAFTTTPDPTPDPTHQLVPATVDALQPPKIGR